MPSMLFVDNDHAQWDDLLARAGQPAGWTHESVPAVEAALEKLRNSPQRFDLVLLDFGLPAGLSGLEGISAIRKAAPDLPVIVFTGQDSKPEIRAAVASVRSGAWDYVSKLDFDANQFFQSASQAVEESRLRRLNARLKGALEQVVGGEPAFLTKPASGGTYDCCFGLRLLAIQTLRPLPSMRADGTPRFETKPTAYVAWVGRTLTELVSMAPGQSLQLRYVSSPRTESKRAEVQIYLIGNGQAASADEAAGNAQQLWAELVGPIAAARDLYHFLPINSAEYLEAILNPFPLQSLVEVARTGRIVRPVAREGIGSPGGTRSDVFVPFAGTSSFPGPSFYYVLEQMVGFAFNCMIQVQLSPHSLSLEERAMLSRALHGCENFTAEVLMPDRLTNVATSKAELKGYSAALSESERALARGFYLRGFLAASSTMPESFVNMVGNHWFGSPNQWDRLEARPSDLLSTASPQSLPASDDGMIFRYLFPPEAAISVFRLPWPVGQMELPGVQLVHPSLLDYPRELPEEGALIGVKRLPQQNVPIRLSPEGRRQHVYLLGQTGTGKSTLLYSILRHDVENGEGVCVIDPHGDLVTQLLSSIPAKRENDLILFDPSDAEWPVGLNMLEYDPARPEQKSFIINEMMQIFGRLYDMSQVGGPIFELYMRNAMLLLMDDPGEAATLMDISRVFTEGEFRDRLLSKCQDPTVCGFWKSALKTSGEASLANMTPYMVSKINPFTCDHFVRPMIAQAQSTIALAEVLRERKILLVKLPKGVIGESCARLLGMVLIAKLLVAAMGCSEAPEQRGRFCLAVDEFQNFATDVLLNMLTEGRKFGLDLLLAHQHLAQLEPQVRETVLSNSGNQCFFRLGPVDARLISLLTQPEFAEEDLVNLPNFKVVGRLLIRGQPSRPFFFEIAGPVPELDAARVAQLRETSRKTYGRPRHAIEEAIRKRWKQS